MFFRCVGDDTPSPPFSAEFELANALSPRSSLLFYIINAILIALIIGYLFYDIK
jgi:hypothetical protein